MSLERLPELVSSVAAIGEYMAQQSSTLAATTQRYEGILQCYPATSPAVLLAF